MEKKYYTPLTMGPIHVETEGCFLAASMETKTKDFNVTTGNYEVTTESWYSNNPTFDNPIF